MKIRLLAIEGCHWCEGVKKKFEEWGIYFDLAYCEKDPTSCDCVESIVGTSNYPMALLEKNGEILEIVYVCDSYEVLSEGNKVISNTLTIPNHSVDGIALYVKKRLNL